MLDHLGLSSQHWKVIDGMDERITADIEQSISDLAKRSVELAIMQHRLLIESVGVPEALAQKTAVKCWMH